MGFSGKLGQTESSLSEINVTPLVDVMLVLLVIFMVTAPILQTGIEVNLPRTRTATTQDAEQRAVITIGRDEILYYRAQSVNFNQLGEMLQNDVTPGEKIFLQADEDVRWKTVVSVLDEVRLAGFEDQVSLVTKPLEANP